MPTFYLGATYILHRQFDPEETIAAIERERVTHIMLVPSQIVALLGSPRFRSEATGIARVHAVAGRAAAAA